MGLAFLPLVTPQQQESPMAALEATPYDEPTPRRAFR